MPRKLLIFQFPFFSLILFHTGIQLLSSCLLAFWQRFVANTVVVVYEFCTLFVFSLVCQCFHLKMGAYAITNNFINEHRAIKFWPLSSRTFCIAFSYFFGYRKINVAL